MKYFANSEADAVVKEDNQGNRYLRTIENLNEHPASKKNPKAWGISSYGVTNFLEPITKEEYESFGITWDWSPRTGEKRSLVKN